MKKWIFCLLSLSPVYLLANPTPLSSDLKAINEEIQVLKNQLNKIRLEEVNEEVSGQGLMIGDWDAYAKDLQHVRKKEEEDKQIVQKIKMLEERKANLMKMQIHSKQ